MSVPFQNAQAGPSTAHPTLKKKTSQTSLTSKRKRNETPDDSQDSASSSRKAREGPKKKKANRACFHCQKAHLTCDDCEQRSLHGHDFIPLTTHVSSVALCSSTMPTLHKARYCEQLHRGAPQEGQVSAGRRGTRYAYHPSLCHRGPSHHVYAQSNSGGARLDCRCCQRRSQLKSQHLFLLVRYCYASHTHLLTWPSLAEPAPQSDSILATAFDPAFAFGSEAANLEYSILSAIIGNPSPTDSASTSPPPAPPSTFSSWPDAIDFSTSPRLGTVGSAYPSSFNDVQLAQSSLESALTTSPNPPYLTYGYSQSQRSEDAAETPLSSQFQSQASLHPLQPRYPLDGRPRSPPTVAFGEVSLKDVVAPGLLTPPLSNGSPSSIASAPVGAADQPPAKPTVESIHDRVTTPYDYTQGYHFLMKLLPTRYVAIRHGIYKMKEPLWDSNSDHLLIPSLCTTPPSLHMRYFPQRFEKNDILRIVRALAIYRPSLIALQMPLSLEDEVFVEKCFQRSLLVSRTT